MKRWCKNRCINVENCEFIRKEKYENIYEEYSKLYNTSILRIEKFYELQYAKDNIIDLKSQYKNHLIDRVIAMTTLIITGCSILIERDTKFTLILLGIIFVYVIYCEIKNQKNKKSSNKLSKEIRDINFNIMVLKNLIYEEDNICV